MIPIEARQAMVRPSRDVLSEIRSLPALPCTIPLTVESWTNALSDSDLDKENRELLVPFEDLVAAAFDAPHRIRPIAAKFVDAVVPVARDLHCLQAFHPAGPEAAQRLRNIYLDCALACIDIASGVGSEGEFAEARENLISAIDDFKRSTDKFSFPTDVCELAFGVQRDDVIDEFAVFSSTRLLAAYYGKYRDLASRLGIIVSALTSQPPDLLRALAPAEALLLSSRPLITLRVAVQVRDLFQEMLNEDLEALASPLRKLTLSVDRSAASHAAVVRLISQRRNTATAAERAAIDLDIYRRIAESQLRPWGWALLQIIERTDLKASELSSLRERLVANGHPLLLEVASAILPAARNAAAHEDYVWNDDSGVIEIGKEEIRPNDLNDASDRAYCFMIGAEAAWRCVRDASQLFGRALDIDDAPPHSAALLQRSAVEHFGTNGLHVRRWSHDAATLTVVVDKIPLQRVNPCFQAIMWASRLLERTDRFVVTTPEATRPAMELNRPPLDVTFLIWKEAFGRFASMPLSTFLPVNTWARLAVELPDDAVRSASWLALNDAVLSYDEAHDGRGPIAARLQLLVAHLDVISAAVAATIAVLPVAALAPLAEVLELTRSGASATKAAMHGLSAAGAGKIENLIRDCFDSLPSASVLPTLDDRPLGSEVD